MSQCFAKPDARIIKFDTASNMEKNKNTLYVCGDGITHGKYEIVTKDDPDAPYIKFYHQATPVQYKSYRCIPQFSESNFITAEYKYVRVKYRTTDKVASSITFRRSSNIPKIVPNTKLSNGEWVVSAPFEVSEDIMELFVDKGNVMMEYTAEHFDADICIKEVAFFKSEADAYAYYGDEPVVPTPESANHQIKIMGNDIANYKIVIPVNSCAEVANAANMLADYIKSLCGVTLSVVTDDEPDGKYEILMGSTNRKLSAVYLKELLDAGAPYTVYCSEIVGNTPVINALVPAACEQAVEKFVMTYLYKGMPQIPEIIDIDAPIRFSGHVIRHSPYAVYDDPVNVADPTVFCEDFASDKGYFTEENGEKLWKYENGAYVYTGNGYSVSYVHVYEQNVSETVTLSYKNADKYANFGLVARYVASAGYAKAGYDFRRGEWYIEFREGLDLGVMRWASKPDVLTPDTKYTLSFTVDGKKATLTVNGKPTVECEIYHITPGCIGVYADGVTVTAENYKAVLLSGEGTIFRNAVHNLLPDDEYREGGSVIVLKDNVWMYRHQRGAAFKSLNNGTTWERTEKWADITSYFNMLRLNNGAIMQIARKTVDGVDYVYSRSSTDEGVTWTDDGIICPAVHPKLGIGSGNMNDKIMQSGRDDRIFFSLNYDNRSTDINTKRVFCEYYYSDDNGKSWYKADMGSLDIKDNGNTTFFGENKLLECADGTIRMYCSWNRMGNIVYSDSTDGGMTFGPLQNLEGFISSHSSMQFVRDPYGPTDTSYFMVWVYNIGERDPIHPVRARLCLAYSTDGKEWEYIGDIWRWESRWRGGYVSAPICHLVDPFIKLTEDYIITGSGISEKFGKDYHNEQRQHIWAIRRDTLPSGKKYNKNTKKFSL